MPERRDAIEPNVGDERLNERNERGRMTEQGDLDSPRRGSSRDLGRDVERGTRESEELGPIDVDQESEELER